MVLSIMGTLSKMEITKFIMKMIHYGRLVNLRMVYFLGFGKIITQMEKIKQLLYFDKRVLQTPLFLTTQTEKYIK